MNRSFFLTASVCCVLFFTMPPSLRAATITVTNTNDEGAGSLRDALASAADGDTIAFSVAGTILLTNGELVVTNDVAIIGSGPNTLAIDGNATSRVFHIGPSNVVSISSLSHHQRLPCWGAFPGHSRRRHLQRSRYADC